MRLVLAAASLALLAPTAAQQNRFEPNQTRRTAARIEPGDYKGLFCDGEDWYTLTVEAGQRLEVSARFTHAEGDLELELQDARGKLLAWSRGTRDEEVLAFTPLERTPVFLRVNGPQGTNVYDLHLGLTAAKWSGSGSGGQVNCWGADWYPVRLEAGKQLRAELNFQHAQGDLDLALFDPEGNELASATGQGDTERLSFTATEDRTVLLEVVHVQRSRNLYTLSLTQGEAVPDDLSRVLGKERPAQAGDDLLELRNGDVLRGTLIESRLLLTTPYADLNLPVDRLAGLDLERNRTEVEGLISVDNNRYTGFLRAGELRFRLAGTPEPLAVPRERVARVILGRRGDERAKLERHQYVVLKSGDHFGARLHGTEGWVLDLGFTTLPLDPRQLVSIAFQNTGEAVVTRLDQSRLRGRLNLERVEVELDLTAGTDVSHRFTVHVSRVDTLYLQEGHVPDTIRPTGRQQSFDFEEGLEPWTGDGNPATSWQHRPGEGVGNGGCVRACGPNGANYGDNANASLTSPPIPVAGMTAPTLRLQAKTRLERGPDFFVVRVSYDGGQTYTELNRITGDQEWSVMSLPLLPGQQEVVVQLGITTDGSIVSQGVWIDQVEVVEGAGEAPPGGG